MTKPKRPPVVLLVVALVLIAAIGFSLWRYTRFNDVHVVNGLPAAIDVTLGGKTQQVGSGGRVTFKAVSAGTHVIEAKHQGQELETTLVFVKGGGHVLVYNIGGAAPLVWERIAYTTRSVPSEPQWNMYCGRRFIELDSVDYVFKEPPKSISTKGGGTVHKTHLTLDDGGLKTCESWALDKGSQDMWSEWQRLEAKLDPKKALAAIEELGRQGDFREAQLLIEQALQKAPSLELHRLYQHVLIASGQRAKALAKYDVDPNDTKASEEDLYLAARLLPFAQRLGWVGQALTRFPDSSMLRMLRAHALDRRGDTAQALADYDLAERGAPESLQWQLAGWHIAALLRAKRSPDAWSAAQSLYKDSTTIDGAVSYARVAEVTGHSDSGWDAKLKPYQQRWARSLLGRAVVEPPANAKERDPDSFKKARDLIRYTLVAAPAPAPSKKKGSVLVGSSDLAPPRAALTLAGRALDSELRLLPESMVWLLLTEAWRLGDTTAAARLTRHAARHDAPRLEVALKFISTGELDAELDLVNDLELAVLWLARGRRLATLGEDPKPAFDEARRLDAFHSLVWRALDTWPEAKPGERLAWVPVSAP